MFAHPIFFAAVALFACDSPAPAPVAHPIFASHEASPVPYPFAPSINCYEGHFLASPDFAYPPEHALPAHSEFSAHEFFVCPPHVNPQE